MLRVLSTAAGVHLIHEIGTEVLSQHRESSTVWMNGRRSWQLQPDHRHRAVLVRGVHGPAKFTAVIDKDRPSILKSIFRFVTQLLRLIHSCYTLATYS